MENIQLLCLSFLNQEMKFVCVICHGLKKFTQCYIITHSKVWLMPNFWTMSCMVLPNLFTKCKISTFKCHLYLIQFKSEGVQIVIVIVCLPAVFNYYLSVYTLWQVLNCSKPKIGGSKYRLSGRTVHQSVYSYKRQHTKLWYNFTENVWGIT